MPTLYRYIVSGKLLETGCYVVEAKNADHARRLFLERPSGGLPFDHTARTLAIEIIDVILAHPE